MEYTDLIYQCLSLIKMRRDEQMDTIFNYGDYGLKPMFLEKYTPLKQNNNPTEERLREIIENKVY